NQEQINQRLLQRITQLEAQIKELQEKQQAPVSTPQPAPAPEPVAAETSSMSPNPLQINLFGDLGFRATDAKGLSNSFYIGSLDLFMTAHLSSKVSGLGEVLFISSSDNSISPDIERLVLQYKASDFLTAGIGRYHTAIGYYNTAFHQG